MRLTYDPDHDSAYIRLTETKPSERQAVHQMHTSGSIVLDFDEHHRLIGIEVLTAQKALPPELLRKAETGGPDLSHWYEA